MNVNEPVHVRLWGNVLRLNLWFDPLNYTYLLTLIPIFGPTLVPKIIAHKNITHDRLLIFG